MLDVVLLGTGGMFPLPGRYLTSLLVRHNGKAALIDCGEGTQIAIRAAGQGFKQIETICLTHFHADHTAGLPGLLLTIGNSGKTTPLRIIGPKGVQKVVECLCIIAPQLPFPLEFIEIDPAAGLPLWDNLALRACAVEHWIPCYAYRFTLTRQGKFNTDKAKTLGIPVQLWSVLQAGNAVEYDGKTFLPSDVLGPPRKPIVLCYATDLRPSDALAQFAKDCDLFICEGMYGDPVQLEKALEHKHCLFGEAAEMAKKAGAAQLWLTHFSPALPDPAEFLHFATDVFANTSVDRQNTTLHFEES